MHWTGRPPLIYNCLMNDKLDFENGQALVRLARRSLKQFVRQQTVYEPDLAEMATAVTHPGCSFVTLTNRGRLRGCIGSTEPRWPLAEDVARHAAAAARDPRFVPVDLVELDDIRLEVTILTLPGELDYVDYADLLGKLRPGKDGVILTLGTKRGVLLPQVWGRIPDPARFLAVITGKAGIAPEELRRDPPTVGVQIFQVQHFAELGYREPGS